jgi:hypothetical protein
MEIHKWTRMILDLAQKNGTYYGFQYWREKRYGRTGSAYDGKDCCGLYADYLNLVVGGTIKTHYLTDMSTSYSVYDHCYIVKDGNIIDPTFRQLFINTTGPKEKMFSPYATFIYTELPIIFVGKPEEFAKLVKQIELEKKKDGLHQNYNIHPIAHMMCGKYA